MTNKSLTGIIADEVIARFKSGFDLDDDTRHFLKSGEGLSCEDEILSFFGSRDFDLSPVYELIFYPDRDMRLKIEHLIPAHGLNEGEIEEIISAVESGRHDIIVNTGSGSAVLQWERFACYAVEYIKRFNLDANVDIFPHRNSFDFQEERIILRRGCVSFSGETSEFFSTFAMQARVRNIPGCAELFSFALNILGGKREKLLEHFESKKFFYESAVRDAAEFAGTLGRYSMEFVMAKKIPVPLISIDEAVETIRKIDLITSLVYGIIIPSVDQGVEMILRDGILSEKI